MWGKKRFVGWAACEFSPSGNDRVQCCEVTVRPCTQTYRNSTIGTSRKATITLGKVVCFQYFDKRWGQPTWMAPSSVQSEPTSVMLCCRR